MKGKYRDADSLVEIDSILTESTTQECIIWQNILGQRVIYNILNIEKSENGKEVDFQLKNYQNDFEPSEAIYVKLKYRGTMFRSKMAKMIGDKVTLRFPLVADVKTIELRSEARTFFDLNEERFLSLAVLHNGIIQKEQIIKLQVIDISESGLCVLVSDKNKNFIQSSLILVLTHLGSEELNKPISLSQKYSSKFRYRKNGKGYFRIRVGFELQEKLKKSILSEFIYANV